MAGVQAEPQPPAAAAGFEQLRELLDRAAQGATGSGGVLQVQRAFLALGECLTDSLARARDRGLHVAGLGRAGVQNDGARTDLVPYAQRVGERGERLCADVGVLACAVQQVHGVDQHALDGTRRHGLPERGHVLLAIDRRLPPAR